MPTLYKHEVIRGIVQDASIGYKNMDYIASSVYPIMPMKTPKSSIWKENKGDQFRNESALRAPGAKSAMRQRKGAAVNLNTYQYGISEMITEEDLQMAGLSLETVPSLNLQQDAVEACADQHDLRQEIDVVANIVAQTWADGNSGGEDAGGLWSPAGSTNTLIADIVKAKKTLQSKGVNPNRLALAIDYATFEAVRHCDDVRDRIKYVSAQEIGAGMIADMLGLLSVNVGSSVKNTANEAADGTDGTFAAVWEKNSGKGMGFVYAVPQRVGMKMGVAGIQPRVDINGAQRANEMWLEKANHAWIVESRENIGYAAVDTTAAYLFVDTYAT